MTFVCELVHCFPIIMIHTIIIVPYGMNTVIMF